MDCPLSENNWRFDYHYLNRLFRNHLALAWKAFRRVFFFCFLDEWKRRFLPFFFLFLLKTENKLKVLYQNSLVYDDVLLRHGEIENYFIIFVVVDVVVIQFILVSNNFCCCWKCAIKMRTVLLKLHLIVSGLLMLTTWKNVHGNHIPNDKY